MLVVAAMDFLLSFLTVVYCVCALYTMATRFGFRLFACTLVSSFCFQAITSAQSCSHSSTAINGKTFPPLIDATTEDLATGLESGLFTRSVDLVNV